MTLLTSHPMNILRRALPPARHSSADVSSPCASFPIEIHSKPAARSHISRENGVSTLVGGKAALNAPERPPRTIDADWF